ncbi:hypothetical protein [Streptomyces sp. NPDC047525]|uniref:hypothetical protein n=1 Tax=Streptomyces sp. NPDC047525 TaxID=3155264 RepID=UPI0033CED935
MAVGQLPDQVREFARYLRDLLARLDPGAGWCGVFWSRDPEGMQACLDGSEVPPWDVMEALLHDLATRYGAQAAEPETERARALHGASLAAYDARPGGRGLLGERLDMMLTEQRFAVERQADLGRALAAAATPHEVERLNRDLAWVRDDHERATARCAELRERIELLDRADRPQWVDFGTPVSDDFAAEDFDAFDGQAPAAFGARGVDGFGGAGDGLDAGSSELGGRTREFCESPEGRGAPAPDSRTVSVDVDPADSGSGSDPEASPHDAPAVPKQGRKSRDTSRRPRRPRGARFAGFAGLDEGVDAADAVAAPQAAGQPPAVSIPRGARFAHASDGGGDEAGGRDTEGPDRDAEQATAEAVAALVRLRGEGRSGEAHGVLVEAAGWPAARIPVLAGELHRAGLGADWSTLLWEAASLPPDRLVALADALAGSGRADDCRKLLRQGVSRPAPEIAEAVLALIDAGREREARALLDAYLRVRTPEDAAGCAHTDPYRLIPLLLQAAQGVSDERHWDLVHALRVAGFSA